MIMLIVNFTVAEGKAAEFEEVMGRLATATRANEPDTLLYQLAKSEKDPTMYRIVEIYKDQATMDAHSASEHFRSISPEIGPLLAAKPEFQKLVTVG